MGMSAFYGPPKAEEDMIHLIHHVVELGITFFDTADAYGPFNNKILSGKVSLSNNVLAL
jgi:aryl-alcohol dehydrogenase-like predicted oxidoreductase